VITMRWKVGAVPEHREQACISATRTEIARTRDLPGIMLGGLRLRARWSSNPGSIGVRLGVDLRRRVSYSVSAWRSPEDLDRFVRSEHHRRVIAPYRTRVDVHAVRWEGDCTDHDALWREARDRLANGSR